MFRGITAISILTIVGSLASASTSVLPANIDSPSFRYGTISGIENKYTSRGTLMSLGDLNSLELDAKNLVQIEPEAKQLISALNSFGNYKYGDNLHLGNLLIETKPSVSYFAPVYARGITDRWTLGMGAPVVTYKNKITLTSSGSNLKAVESELRGLSPELDAAFDRLNVNLATEASRVLAEKKYKPLENRDETFLGDIQLVSLYRFLNTGMWSALSRTTFNLPTGPAPDADDLTDIDSFHQTAIDQQMILGLSVKERLFFYTKAGIKLNMPDQIEARVPEKENDLPDADRKESVHRQIGPQGIVGVSSELRVVDTISLLAGMDYIQKQEDRYKGSKNWNYSLLSKNTQSSAQKARLGISYDSTRAYFRKETFMPALLSYEWTDTIAGTNIERQTVNEVSVTIFF